MPAPGAGSWTTTLRSCLPRGRACSEPVQLAEVPDISPRPIAAKLLDRPELIAELRASSRIGRPSSNRGTLPNTRSMSPNDFRCRSTARVELWHLGFKSAGRRLFVAGSFVYLQSERTSARSTRCWRPLPRSGRPAERTGVVVKLTTAVPATATP